MLSAEKNKYFLFLAFLFIFLFCSSGFASALEVKGYPPVPGLVAPSAECNAKTCLAIYVAYWFGLLVYTAGILALISFTIGAVGFMVSIDSAEVKSGAKDRMKGALLGLALTVVAFLILKTINPTLVRPSLEALPGVDGVFYTNNTEDKPAPVANSDTSTIPEGFNNIKYVCSDGPALLIWEFPEAGLEGGNDDLSKVKVARKKCGEQESIGNYGSFKIAFETSGVYYCLGECSGDMCAGYMSSAVNSDENNISSPFNGKIKGVRIVNDKKMGVYYGVIFHRVAGLENAGECSGPIINEDKDDACKPVNIQANSDNIFKWNNANSEKPSGSGVDFYSEPFGSAAGAQKRGEGFCAVNNNMIGRTFSKNVGELSFGNTALGCGYAKNTNNDTKNLYQNTYRTFQNKSGSMNIKGSYLVVLYSGNADSVKDGAGGSYCQTFSKSVFNLKVQPFMATGHSIGSIYIIPTK